jgi:hypothetical protein
MAMASIAATELVWWLAVWWLGFAPAPLLAAYVAFAGAALLGAIAVRRCLGLAATAAPWSAVIAGTLLVAVGASVFLPLKYAIPQQIPFWLDRPLALAEGQLFGVQPWVLLDRFAGWATLPLDWLYATWLPTQLLALFLLILSRPSPAKNRALIAYSLGWFGLGVIAATLLSSAGPLFYDRLMGGGTFAGLTETLLHRGAWAALAESNGMWAALHDGRPGLVAGISAVPSMHVAISLWIYLTARQLVPRLARPALIYTAIIWIGSVQLGWHYVSDGLIGVAGMLAVWAVTGACGSLLLGAWPAPRGSNPQPSGSKPDALSS